MSWVSRLAPDLLDLLDQTEDDNTQIFDVDDIFIDDERPKLYLEEARGKVSEVLAQARKWVTEAPDDLRDFLDFDAPGESSADDVSRERTAVVATPCGTFKTQAAIQRQIKSGHGTILEPNHKLATEVARRIEEATGEPTTVFRGLLERCPLSDESKKGMEVGLDKGWSAGLACAACPKRDGCPAHEPQALAGVVVGTHGVLPYIGAPLTFPTPVIIDEAPNFIETRTMTLADVIRLRDGVARHRGKKIKAFMELRRGVLNLLVDVMVDLEGDRKRQSPSWKTRYPYRVSGAQLRSILAKKMGDGEEGLVAMESKLRASHDVDAIPTPPSSKRVLRGDLSDWPPAWLDEILLGVLDAEDRSTCISVGGAGDGAEVAIERRSVSRTAIPPRTVILDATGHHHLACLQAAFPDREFKLFNLAVDEHEGAVRRVFIRGGGISRAALLTRGKLGSEGEMVVAGHLERILKEVRPDTPCPAKIGVVSYMGVADAINKAWAEVTDKSASGSAVASSATTLLGALRAMKDSGQVSDIKASGYFSSNRGTNQLAGVDVLILLGTPHKNWGEGREIARLLNVHPRIVADAACNSELEQAEGRGRPLQVVERDSLTIVAMGDRMPPGAAWWDARRVELVPGPARSQSSKEAEAVCRLLYESHGAVCPAFVRLLIERPGLAAKLPLGPGCLPEGPIDREPGPALEYRLQELAGLTPTTLKRAFRRAFPAAQHSLQKVKFAATAAGQSKIWRMVEVTEGAAAELMTRLAALMDASSGETEGRDKPAAPSAPGPTELRAAALSLAV